MTAKPKRQLAKPRINKEKALAFAEGSAATVEGDKRPQKGADKAGAEKRPSRATQAATESPASMSGKVPEGDVRLTANVRQDLHLKLKIAAAEQRTTIGELIEDMIEERYG